MSPETFERLLALNLPGVQRLVHSRLENTGYAEDVLQDILMRAFARRNQLRVQAKFRTWLWSIALNEIRQHFRRDRGTVSLDENPHLVLRDHTISPVARVERLEASEWLRACMSGLSARHQAAIRLRDIEERSCSEAAAALQCSLSATKTAHFRARKRLAHIIHVRRHGYVPTLQAA